MRGWWGMLFVAGQAAACAQAPKPVEPAARAEMGSPAVQPAPASAAVATPPPSSPAAEVLPVAPIEPALEKGKLPVVCEAYFAKFMNCMDASASKHPDERTRAEIHKRFEEAEQKSRAMMTAAMEPKDAEAYCKQALFALTASPCS